MASKIFLPEDKIPKQWYNIVADLPSPMDPVLHPATGRPVTADDLGAIFPPSLIEQEMSQQRWIDIPESIIEKYLIWRPTPLRRALALERYLETPARIYYKDESVSPPGSHKPNTAIPQAYFNKVDGTEKICTETGAGQWGSALAFATSLFGIQCEVYMVRISYNQKPYRRIMMETWGATCIPSPSDKTETGRKILESNPDSPGSLGIAISEAIEAAITQKKTRYALGSVLNHVILHQTVIGLEAVEQMKLIGEYPDVVIGCAGGGSNFAGLAFPFVRDKIHGKDIDVIAVEPASCPTLTKGLYTYDFGDTSGKTPLLPMHTLGHHFVPAPLHAGGLRYHGMAPLVSKLLVDGLIRAVSVQQLDTFAAGITWARTEGYIPAPETTHAIAAVIEEAKRAKEEGREKVILFSWSGHGLLDLAAYEAYLEGKLVNYSLSEEEIREALKELEHLPKPSLARKKALI
ncbi:MAG: TrpB-like pyridoxal phosphate-dependent enzyme [Thermodesulforhabdaceae bacterium]